MRFPQDAMSQQHLVGHLRGAIDRVLHVEAAMAATVPHCRDRAPGDRAMAALDALLDTNPNAVASRHVQHNIGARRRAWLAEYQRARATRVASSIPAITRSSEET